MEFLKKQKKLKKKKLLRRSKFTLNKLSRRKGPLKEEIKTRTCHWGKNSLLKGKYQWVERAWVLVGVTRAWSREGNPSSLEIGPRAADPLLTTFTASR